MSNKYHLICYNNRKSVKIKNIIEKKLETSSIKKASIIIVIGGDGFMLKILKKYFKYRKPFYGINSGNYGFLMNKFNPTKFQKRLSSTNLVQVNPLQVGVRTRNNQKKTLIAINEVSILRQSKQASSVKVLNGKKVVMSNLVSDGILVSTPAGSTAYNLSVHGPILNLNSKKLAITPVSPFRPRRWRGKIVSDKSKIKIINLNFKKRPVSAVADNQEVRNAIMIDIKVNKKIKFNLLYDKYNNINKKIKIEQLRKEIYSN